jgi:2-polyprenyl-6-hydroxyphenyl methylase/3-demethylubiquinone-9 3-methyltransferase
MGIKDEVNNSIYDKYGDQWYTAVDDPIALLRAENKVKAPWVLDRIQAPSLILDVGCGAGFLTNELALAGHQVTGVDLSESSLAVAARFDKTKTVTYKVADAYELPFSDGSFDVLCSMDFLEHVEDPARAIKEFARVLKPGGTFFYHTFNRNLIAWLVIIKLVEWLIPKTPKNMHLLRLFIKPHELKNYCKLANLDTLEMVGIRPVFSSIPVKKIFSGQVPPEMRFELTSSLLTSFMGVAVKKTKT